MAIHTSALFAGFRGSVNRQLLFRQCAGKTIVSSFPDRSKVIYSERQKMAQKRFSEAVGFARVVIKEPGLKDIYSVRASLLGFRSAWNLAIAEFMSEAPLTTRKRKIRFDRAVLTDPFGWKVPSKLYKFDEETRLQVLKVPQRIKMKRLGRRSNFCAGRGVNLFDDTRVLSCIVESLPFTRKTG